MRAGGAKAMIDGGVMVYNGDVVSGLLNIAVGALGLRAAAKMGSFCFVAGTPIVMAQSDDGAGLHVAWAIPAAAVTVAIIGAGYLEVRARRKRREQEEKIDALFAALGRTYNDGADEEPFAREPKELDLVYAAVASTNSGQSSPTDDCFSNWNDMMEFDDPDVDGDESASETAKSYQPRKNFAPISNASLTRTQTTARRTKASRSKPPTRRTFAHKLTPFWLTACLLLALLSSFWAKGTAPDRPRLLQTDRRRPRRRPPRRPQSHP